MGNTRNRNRQNFNREVYMVLGISGGEADFKEYVLSKRIASDTGFHIYGTKWGPDL